MSLESNARWVLRSSAPASSRGGTQLYQHTLLHANDIACIHSAEHLEW